MKRIAFLILAVTLAACLSPSGGSGAPQVTVTSAPTECCAKVTVTLTLEPTVTSTPVESPETALSTELLEKFKNAGIDPNDLDIDENGLHMTFEDGSVVDVPTDKLNNFVYFENEITGEVMTFMPVRNNETKQTSLYVFDTETKTWSLSKTLEKLTISTNENSPSTCTFEHVKSGDLAENLREQKIIFPEDAENKGWDYKPGETGPASIYLVNGSKDVMKLVNFCKMPADFLGLKGTIDVATVAVLNPDGSIGFLNYSLGNDKRAQKYFLNSLDSGGYDTGIMRKPFGNFSESLKSAPLLYKLQLQDLKVIINTIQIDDKVSADAGKFIFLPSGR